MEKTIKYVGKEFELVTSHSTMYGQVVENRSKAKSIKAAVESVFESYTGEDYGGDVNFMHAEVYKRDVYKDAMGVKYYTEPKEVRRITFDEWYERIESNK